LLEAAAPTVHSDDAPLITVALPVYNGGRFLRPAVLSIVKQTFTDWELLIIDDGSTDGSLEFIRDIKDARIRIIRDGLNKGLAARLNEAINLARGQYFARMDQDDIAYPERFARQVAVLAEDPKLDLVGVRSLAISQHDQIVGYFPYASSDKELCAMPWVGFYIVHPTWMGRTAWFRHHRYATPGPYLCEDQELLLRAFATSRFTVIDDILFAYRVRDQIVWRKLVNTHWAVLKIQMDYFVHKQQLGYGLLAVFAFIGRVAMDCWDGFIQMFGGNLRVRYRRVVDRETLAKWRAVLESVSESGDGKG
jgi:glycosyltransferase involved in cell wall biosynthesis